MENTRIQEAQACLRRMNKCLDEVLDLTRQLAEAVDRNDQVCIRMVLGMREEPLGEATEIREVLRERLDTAPPQESSSLREVLAGAPGKTEEERALASQVTANRRLLEQVRQLDEAVNRKLTREKSFYN